MSEKVLRAKAEPDAARPIARLRPVTDARPAGRSTNRPNRFLQRFVYASLAAHGVAALLFLVPPRPDPVPAEAPARIEVLFGGNADVPGVPALAGAASGTTVLAPAREGSEAAPGGSGAGAASVAVRVGEGELGLRLSGEPDEGLIEAQADPGNRAPKYPDIAWRLHQHGRVVIRLHIDTEGHVAEAEVLESSGHPALDRAARETLAQWHLLPALRDGVAVPSFRDQPTNFVLE